MCMRPRPMTLDPSFFELTDEIEQSETEQAEAYMRRLVDAQEGDDEAVPLVLVDDAGRTVFRCRP